MMVFDIIKQYVNTNFLFIFVALGFWFILSQDTDNPVDRKTIRVMRALVVIAFVLSSADFWESYFAELPRLTIWRRIFSWMGYSLRPLVVAMIIRVLVYRNRKTLFFYLPVAVCSLIYATTFIPALQGVAFYFREPNNFMRGPCSYASPILCVLYLLTLVFLIFRKFEEEGLTREVRAVIWCAFVCMAAGFYEMFVSSSGILNAAILISCMFYYFLFYAQATREDKEEKELMLSDQRAAMVVQEIQPRFILEILSRMQNQVESDPEVAGDTLDNLVKYLKKNMESTDFVHPIPFDEEIDRVKTYVRIIQSGFPGLRVGFKLEDTDFSLPALTIQHLVENCINHAFEDRDEGTIIIKSFGSESGHTIIIQDDGKGFETREELASENQGSRFGIANVTDRLQRMCNGDLNFVSRQDSGTTAMISIPNEDVPMPKREKRRRRLEIPGRKNRGV